MSSNLRILLDESITDPLAEEFKSMSGLNVECCRELPIKGASDPDVIAYATKERRIVITTETGMHDKQFPVCTHPGIIVLTGKSRHESIHAGNFQRFMLSGHRKEAKDGVSFISKAEFRVKTHSGPKTYQF